MNLISGYVEGENSKWKGEAKENDLRPFSDRISGTIRRFLLEDLRDRGGMYAGADPGIHFGGPNQGPQSKVKGES